MQALRVDLVPYLLKLLEGVGLETLDNPSATKAQIVKALKSMTRSLQYGEQVSNSCTHTDTYSKLIHTSSKQRKQFERSGYAAASLYTYIDCVLAL